MIHSWVGERAARQGFDHARQQSKRPLFGGATPPLVTWVAGAQLPETERVNTKELKEKLVGVAQFTAVKPLKPCPEQSVDS